MPTEYPDDDLFADCSELVIVYISGGTGVASFCGSVKYVVPGLDVNCSVTSVVGWCYNSTGPVEDGYVVPSSASAYKFSGGRVSFVLQGDGGPFAVGKQIGHTTPCPSGEGVIPDVVDVSPTGW